MRCTTNMRMTHMANYFTRLCGLQETAVFLLFLCFYLIAHPKGPVERDRIGFGANTSLFLLVKLFA